MLKAKLMKKHNTSLRLQQGFEKSTLVVRSNEISPLSLSSSKADRQKIVDVLSDTSIMLLKLPSSSMTKAVQSIFNSAHVNVAFRLDKNTNPDRVSRINSSITFSSSTTPIYVSSDANTISLDITKIEFLSLVDTKKAVQTLYHGLIRLGVLIAGENFSFGVSNDKLVNSLISYYTRFFKHILDLSTLDIRQDMKLAYVISRTLHTVNLKSNIRMVDSYAKDYVNSEFKSKATTDDFDVVFSEVDDADELFKDIESMKDIFKIFHSLGISFDSESSQITKAFSSVGIQNYLAMTSSLDFILGAVILSKYTKIYSKLMLDSTSINDLELEVVKLIKKIKYGSAPDVTKI